MLVYWVETDIERILLCAGVLFDLPDKLRELYVQVALVVDSLRSPARGAVETNCDIVISGGLAQTARLVLTRIDAVQVSCVLAFLRDSIAVKSAQSM